MIHSILFSGDTGYINEDRYELVYKEGLTEEDIIQAKKDFNNNKHRYYRSWTDLVTEEKNMGKKNPQLIHNLKNRKIEFAQDKINIIFGPNGSGKSTILKTLAVHCMCGNKHTDYDGFTNIKSVVSDLYLNNISEKKTIYKIFDNNSGNHAEVDWDGNPVYFDNYKKASNSNSNYVNTDIFDERTEELLYKINQSIMSTGENDKYIIGKIMNLYNYNFIYEKPVTDAEKIIYGYIMDKNPDITDKTILLDEPDRSMDIYTVINLYNNILPVLLEKTCMQFIIVSHSPIILSNIIRNSDKYNIISLDDKYTSEVLQMLNQINWTEK